MFVYRSGRFKGLLRPASVLVVLALALAGCGGSGESPITVPGEITAAEGATVTADADDLEVIEGWSRTLSDGDVEGAADYFAVPSSVENGGLTIEIRSSDDAVAFNESLPCGAELLGAETDGDVTTATFELSDRPGGDCGAGAGGEAATAFRIEDGEIVEWQRVAASGGGPPAGGDAGAPV